jgi:hypothetical protein
MIYQEGRSTVHSSIQTVGKTNTLAQVKIRTQGTSTGVQQTGASLAAMPPGVPELFPRSKRIQGVIAIGTVVAGVLVFAYGAESGWNFGETLTGVALAGFVGLSLWVVRGSQPTPQEIAAHRKRHRDAFAALDRWNSTFACAACGERFIPR